MTIYDVEHSYVAFTCSIPTPCKAFTLAGVVHSLTSAGVLSTVVERPLTKKLEVLLKKGLYDLAIELSKRERAGRVGGGVEALWKLYVQYGDYLYE